MLMAQVHQSRCGQAPQIPLPKPFLTGGEGGASASFNRIVTRKTAAVRPKPKTFRVPYAPTNSIKALFTIADKLLNNTNVKGVVTIVIPLTDPLKNLGLSIVPDVITDFIGLTLGLELVAADLDPKTGSEKETVKGFAYYGGRDGKEVKYEINFQVPRDFGNIGAVLVENNHTKEMFIQTITLDGLPDGPVNLACNSWVQSKFKDPQKRVFFTDKSFLPSNTPSALKSLRVKELTLLQGDGTGERQPHERIYDYDVYNDLGNPDVSDELARPVLGGKEHPYPRRCRTGRPPSLKDPKSESRTLLAYVPRDEDFSEVKTIQFGFTTLYTALHAVLPTLEEFLVDADRRFPYFTAIDTLFNEGIHAPQLNKNLRNLIPRIFKAAQDTGDEVLLFETPELIDRDKFSWFRDEEFSRQTLAGLNPYSIQLVTEWPLKSNLDSQVYGPQESAITKEIVEEEIRGYMTLEEALKEKKLFILDYHDLFLPYVSKVRELEGTTLYASRTLFFLTPAGTLRPLAIELTRPPTKGKSQWKQVFAPCWDATGAWLWKLAKAHVLAHDSAHHQLISHWLRTHCVTEPYIIASHRQLSAMHPIYRLLHPHFTNTMNINGLARVALINAGGIIESTFSAGKYAMEISSVVYDQQWRFDHEGLPADLISRGMAVEDQTAPHGLKLTIEDYPFANDGLLLWDAIKQWVTDYVNHYYPEASLVEADDELRAWWTEIRTVGHADKKDEPWWPVLKTPDDLIGILTTIIWVTSGHHAAVNFGQYDFAGYFPNRPTIARTKVPTEDPTDEEWKQFEKRPEDVLLSTLPSQIQATKVMTVLDVLSTHSPDEEYIGEEIDPHWAEDEIIKAAFDRFNGRLKEIEEIIEGRNADQKLKNRTGAGVVPYQLLKPFSEAGATGKGVPNSISI